MAKYNAVEIEVEFSNGSFEEWANGNEEQSPEDIAVWKAAYYTEIKTAIEEVYPNAKVSVSESTNQTTSTKVFNTIEIATTADADYTEDDEDIAELLIDDKVKNTLDGIFAQVANTGTFWEA